jgi:hypothetical protein
MFLKNPAKTRSSINNYPVTDGPGRNRRVLGSNLGHCPGSGEKLGVTISSVRRMEGFDGEVGARTSTLSLVQKALDRAGWNS